MTRDRIRALNKNSSSIHHLSIENVKNYKLTRNTKIASIFHNNPLSSTIEDKNKFWIAKIKIFDINEYCNLYFDNRGTVSDALLLLSNFLRPKQDVNSSWYLTTNKNQMLQGHYPLFYYVSQVMAILSINLRKKLKKI